MTVPRTPLFALSLTDPRDAWVFEKESELGGIIEPPEWEEHAHVVFDSVGNKAKVAVKNYGVVVVGWSEDSDPEEFESLIRRSLEAYGSPAPDEEREEMVKALATLLRKEQARHDLPGRLFNRLFRRGGPSTT